jgi:hypothetical protein
LFIEIPFSLAHVTSRDHADLIFTDDKTDKQPSTCIGLTEQVITGFGLGMGRIGLQQERDVEKDFLAFAIRDLVFLPVLIAIAIIPIKASDREKVNHFCISLLYTLFELCQPQILGMLIEKYEDERVPEITEI